MAKRKISKKTQKEVVKTAKKYPKITLAIVILLIICLVGCCFLHYKRIITISFLEGIIPQEKVVEDKEEYTVDVQQNVQAGGTIEGAGAFKEGETATLRATANQGYAFVGWFNGATCVSYSQVYTFTVTANTALEARFAPTSGGDGTSTSTDDLQIHFLELGNASTGDCTLIKTGDTEVLIDAGSLQSSAAHLNTEIAKYCTDGKLEYVVATHAHTDHIGAFVGTSSKGVYNGILYTYDVGTIIQFPLTKKEATASNLYGKYLAAVDYAVSQGAVVYTALECWNYENGAQRTYTLAEGITFNILYQKYYETYDTGDDENNYSVCTLLSQGNNHYLFTGDLEADGEESLVTENDLPRVKLYKAGHHGSPTSSSAEFMAVIQPEIICVCCCCGNMEYTDNPLNDFPSQAFVDNVAPYTDKIYVTTITDGNDGFMSYNGTITVSSNGSEVTVNCSNNNTIFKETDWFKANRTWPSNGVGGS
ncbi:MAG: MBL fold metallo-hydrolase [Clostridia bacterium]|nr:MBL fold metallo-hydrolase [Clostridia bacterium]